MSINVKQIWSFWVVKSQNKMLCFDLLLCIVMYINNVFQIMMLPVFTENMLSTFGYLTKWHDIRPSMVTHTRNLCSAFNKVHTHSSEHTLTVNTHPEQWAAIYAVAPGKQLGVRCLAQGLTSVVVLRVERALYIHSPHLQFLPVLDSNPRPFDYESDSLTIRPQLRFGHDLCTRSD